MKRYVAEPGSELLRQTMRSADSWFTCRVTYVEAVRAVGMIGGAAGARAVRDEWPVLNVIEVDQRLAEMAADLALEHGLRTLDALHLAAASILTRDDLAIATWDRRLHGAAVDEGLAVVPASLE